MNGLESLEGFESLEAETYQTKKSIILFHKSGLAKAKYNLQKAKDKIKFHKEKLKELING